MMDDTFAPNDNETAKIGKLVFGKNADGNAQEWYYSKKITGDKPEIINISTIKNALNMSTDIDLSKCRIWLEMPYDNMIYAINATENVSVIGAGRPSGATVKTINLNAAALRPDSTWSKGGNIVYFGKYKGTATEYRVLASPNTQENSENYLLLDYNTILEAMPFSNESSAWIGDTCTVRKWLNGTDFYDGAAFSSLEKSAIAETALAEQREYTVGDCSYKDYSAQNNVFCLSAAEADGLYTDDAARKKAQGTTATWWLRSSGGTTTAGDVLSRGKISSRLYGNDYSSGVSPALNVNMSKVLFASESGKDKSTTIASVSESTAKQWKLTLLDSNKAVNVTNGQSVTATGNNGYTEVTVPYTYTESNTNPVSQISVMITDKAYTGSDAQVLYYGALQNTTITGGGASGTGSFILPADLEEKTWGTDYHVYIIAEDVNGDEESDYASAPLQLFLPGATTTEYTIKATAGENGFITPSGPVKVEEGSDKTFIIHPYSGYMVDTVKVDDVKVYEVTGYTFRDVQADHTIEVTFKPVTTPPSIIQDKLVRIVTPSAITVANGTAYDAINLPTTVTIETEKQTVTTADVTWDTTTPASGSYDPAVKTEQTVTLNGTVTCPDNVDANNVSLTTTITITIRAAQVPTPEPTPTPTPTIPEHIEYRILDGGSSVWEQKSDGSIIIRGNGAFYKFIGVKVDGTMVDAKNYTAKEGSTIITLNADYLNTLSVGDHTFEIVWTDGTAQTSFKVNEAAADPDQKDEIKDQKNKTKVKALLKNAKIKVTTKKTTKKNVKVTASMSKSMLKDIESMGYTVKYKFYRSTKKDSKYTALTATKSNTYTYTNGTKGKKYYYKVKVLVYDGKKLIAQTTLKQCSCGARGWSK